MNPDQQIQTLTEIVGELKDQVTELSEASQHQQLEALRHKLEAQQQQIVQLSEFISLVTEAIPGELFPSYQLTPGEQSDGIDLQRTRSCEKARRRAAQAVRQITTRWSTPYPPGSEELATEAVRGERILRHR